MRKADPKKFFSCEEEEAIVSAIRKAESKTSGEIRVHLARKGKGTPHEEAVRIFERLGMAKTVERNGILFYLALTNHHFAVIGDRGIHEKVSSHFWEQIRGILEENFRKGEFVKGLVEGIASCGNQLAQHFPRRPGDRNELSDQVTKE